MYKLIQNLGPELRPGDLKNVNLQKKNKWTNFKTEQLANKFSKQNNGVIVFRSLKKREHLRIFERFSSKLFQGVFWQNFSICLIRVSF